LSQEEVEVVSVVEIEEVSVEAEVVTEVVSVEAVVASVEVSNKDHQPKLLKLQHSHMLVKVT
jgi:hypothetical protein